MTNQSKTILIGAIVLIAIAGIWWGMNKEAVRLVEETKEPIKIGAILPLTGELASYGQNTRAAIELAVQEINDEGGINGRDLEVIFEDGKGMPKEAVGAVNKLINIDQVPIFIGGITSGTALAIAPIAENTKTVLFSPCASSKDVTNAGDYIFRDYPSNALQGKVGAEFVYQNLSARKVAILYSLSDWGISIEKEFKENFINLGGSIVSDETFEDTAKDLRTQLTKIKETEPDMIYFISYVDTAIIGLRQIKELGIDAKVYGPEVFDNPKIWAENTSEGVMYSIPVTRLTEEFKSKMKKKTGSEEITMCSAPAYDAVKIITEIMKKVGSDSTKIKNELYKIENYQGVSGIITLDENGDLATGDYVHKIIKDGKAIELK